MEQESKTPSFYDALKRIGYGVTLTAHVLFITLSIAGSITLLITLLLTV